MAFGEAVDGTANRQRTEAKRLEGSSSQACFVGRGGPWWAGHDAPSVRVAAAEALLDWGYERYAEVAPGGGRRGGRDRVARPKLDDSDATPSLEPLADDERTVTLEGAVDEETVTTTIGELAHAAIDGVPVQARG